MFQLEGLNRKSRKSSAIIERLRTSKCEEQRGSETLFTFLIVSDMATHPPRSLGIIPTGPTRSQTLIRGAYSTIRVSNGAIGRECSTSFSQTIHPMTLCSKRGCIQNSTNTPRSATGLPHLRVVGTVTSGTRAGRGLSIDPAERNRHENGGDYLHLATVEW